MLNFLGKIFDSNEKEIKRLRKQVEKINALEPQYEKLKDTELKEKTAEFKKRLEKGPPATPERSDGGRGRGRTNKIL